MLGRTPAAVSTAHTAGGLGERAAVEAAQLGEITSVTGWVEPFQQQSRSRRPASNTCPVAPGPVEAGERAPQPPLAQGGRRAIRNEHVNPLAAELLDDAFGPGSGKHWA